MPSVVMTLHLPSAGTTELLGAALAMALPSAPNVAAVLHLQGELGTGKTTCVRSVLRTFGVTGLVRSPTYTLLETYSTGVLTCVHVDLYRLADESEAQDLGLRDLLEPGTVIMVEWPEKGGAAVPSADIGLILTYSSESNRELTRRARLVSSSPLGDQWLLNLGDDTKLAPYVFNMT